MKELWNYIAPSFFSDKIAKQAPRRGVGSILIVAILAVVFSVLGIIAAYTLTFNANYGNTSALVETVERAFSADGATVEIKDGVLYSDRIVDTVASDEDRQKYSRGYDIVIDTRAVDTLDDFSAYCVSKSGKEISYEEYIELDRDAKTLYSFAIRYSGKERVIDDEWVAKCESYLDGATDEATVKAYADVKKKSDDEYASAVYDLYVRTYYPSLTAYENDGGAPKTRNYYYHNYFRREKIIFVFCDSMIGSFVTDFGAKNSLYGYYGGLKDGVVGSSAADVKQFVCGCAAGAQAVNVYSAIMGFFSVAPFIILAVVAVSVMLFCLNKLMKLDELKFGAAAKTVCAFVTVAALIAALATFALGFFVSQSLLAWLDGVVLFAVLVIRIAVMLGRSFVEHKRASKQNAENEENTAAAAEVHDNDIVCG